MAGGTWSAQNKTRPGVYIRFQTASATLLTAGDRGVVAICKELSWGPVGEVNELTLTSDIKALTGFDITAPENRWLVEMFKGTSRTAGPSKVLLMRPAAADSAQASATIGNLVATAACYGSRGNDITIIITRIVEGEALFEVRTLVSGVVVDTQTGIAEVEELVSNAWVEFSGSGPLEATTGTALTDGADGTVSPSAYAAFLDVIEARKFDVLCYDGDSATVRTAYESFIKRIADENGHYAQLVEANAPMPDSRFIINVVSGVVLSDGTTLTPEETCWWVAGATAGAKYNESLTYAVYPGALTVEPVRTNTDIIDAINNGCFVLQADDGVVRIETDIDSLITYSEDIGRVFRKNRVVRLCNQIANDIYKTFSDNYIGVVNNNEIGRSRFKGAIVSYLVGIQANQGIQNFSADDVEVLPGEDIDAVVVNLAIQPVDAIEKIYITVEVA